MRGLEDWGIGMYWLFLVFLGGSLWFLMDLGGSWRFLPVLVGFYSSCLFL